MQHQNTATKNIMKKIMAMKQIMVTKKKAMNIMMTLIPQLRLMKSKQSLVTSPSMGEVMLQSMRRPLKHVILISIHPRHLRPGT